MRIEAARARRSGILALILLATTTGVQAQGVPFALSDFALRGSQQKEALKVTDSIYQGVGFSNTFLVVTPQGNVIIDTSSALSAQNHKDILKKANAGPIKYIILTHGHDDHTGGVGLWREEGTQIVTQKLFPEMRAYQQRLGGYFSRSNAAQFGLNEGTLNAFTHMRKNLVEPTLTFDQRYDFVLGDTEFQLHAAPGETYDHLFVWLPQQKALFIGDNFYDSFPNVYTLRGTRPRWALDYVASIDKVLALEPEILLPSHGLPIKGQDQVRARLEKYRKAILHVHDAVVQGMNDGKDVFTLMREVKLPPELEVGELYGKLTWSVRGIYEGYVGWFDLNPATMFPESPTVANADLVELAGGPDKVVDHANAVLKAGDAVKALRLSDAALSVDPQHAGGLNVRLAALQELQKQSRNMIEHAWLNSAIGRTQRALEGK
jgi:alkyl sulfatase BDS1-like metallo-beta-lactamase superfamily hydrolase